jgi:hypothetical protein
MAWTSMVRVMAVRAVWTVVVMKAKHGETPFKIQLISIYLNSLQQNFKHRFVTLKWIS